MLWFMYERDNGRLLDADAVLCRNTAPLVDLAYQLIRRGIACHVEGREIGNGLIKLATRWARIKTTDALRRRLEAWLEDQVARMKAKGREVEAGNLDDRVQTIFVLMEGCETVEQLKTKISRLFEDTPDGERPKNLTLSTIHKAKGREWERVYWLGRNILQPSRWARREWELVQEDNLCYVAATRAKFELVEVDLPLPAVPS